MKPVFRLVGVALLLLAVCRVPLFGQGTEPTADQLKKGSSGESAF
jgi:hypothetical protein